MKVQKGFWAKYKFYVELTIVKGEKAIQWSQKWVTKGFVLHFMGWKWHSAKALNVTMLNDVMLSVNMLSVIILSVIILNVVAPLRVQQLPSLLGRVFSYTRKIVYTI